MLIQFETGDAPLLYCIPKSPSELTEIISAYRDTNRGIAPGCAVMQGCLERAFDAGFLYRVGQKIGVDETWYGAIHAADTWASCAFEAMLWFDDWLMARSFTPVHDAGFPLSIIEYRALVG